MAWHCDSMGQNDRLLAQCMNRSKRDGCTEDDTFMKDVDHIHQQIRSDRDHVPRASRYHAKRQRHARKLMLFACRVIP